MYKHLAADKAFLFGVDKVSKREGISPAALLKKIQTGECVIPLNKNRRIQRPCAIGGGLATKINVNIGSSPDKISLREELQKLEIAVELEADAVMDLSIAGDIPKTRRMILDHSPIPVGTVPIYEAAMRAQKRSGSFLKMEKEDIFEVLEEQAAAGVDFFTVHCGINRKSLEVLDKKPRVVGVVSRGGAILVNWMKKNRQENPLYEFFDDCLNIAHKHNIVLSLGDGLRPGSILDATDAPQLAELHELGKLTQRARQAGVGVIIEGPGHVPLNEIRRNIRLQKKICNNAPFYCLGPLVTDVAVGYDHISGAIGGALAAYYGADFLCFLTPAEHIRHPSLSDTREGIVASKIAAHAADIARGLESARDWDRRLSLARKRRDWPRQIKLALDPKKAGEYRKSAHPHLKDVCTMCGEFCSIKLMDECVDVKRG